MQEKLIITLWKAQIQEFPWQTSLYSRLTYNNTQRNSKPTTQQKNLIWKQTFIFPLAKQESQLKIQFIELKEGQAIHFAKDQVAESLSFAKAVVSIPIQGQHHGSLPCKIDIFDKDQENIGKIFIQYEVMKTEVAYTVEKQMDYFYLLKLTNFKVTFVRRLKNNPKFYFYLNIEGRQHKEDLPFEFQQNATFVYNYPVKLYLKKETEAQIQLFIKDQPQMSDNVSSGRPDYRTQSQFSESVFSEKKTFKSSVGKKQKLLLDVSKEKITAILDLNFKRDVKVVKKLPLTAMIKFQKRQIGTIEFQAESFFRSKTELQELQEQKKGITPNPEIKPLERKKSIVKQSNGVITINSILGKLELFNEGLLQNKNMSLEVKLGNQIKQSSILERPGKQIIFIDTFTFKRTWQQTIKIIVNLQNREREKIPTFFAELNLRQLFELGRITSKKIKLKDEHKNTTGQLHIDIEYKEFEQKEKRSPSLRQSMAVISQMPQEELEQMKKRNKKVEIQMRMKHREQLKVKAKELNSMSTLAVLQSNDIILPPLKSISRLSTISPRPEKFKSANMYNVNGSIKFTRSPRFESPQKDGYQSFTHVRQSDFDVKKKRGSSIGSGQKYDFTKVYNSNPGVGRYMIPTVWDKYNP